MNKAYFPDRKSAKKLRAPAGAGTPGGLSERLSGDREGAAQRVEAHPLEVRLPGGGHHRQPN